jgi:adenylate cyclase
MILSLHGEEEAATATERVQRRLAAVLAADVVGYSRLMAADEAGTLAELNALRQDIVDPKIGEHGGRIVKLMGDGALVEFASVVDAVECAVAIQQAMAARNVHRPEDRRIVFRIGINVGDIIIEGDDIFGDGVNVAARLEGLAEPGGISNARSASITSCWTMRRSRQRTGLLRHRRPSLSRQYRRRRNAARLPCCRSRT